jgi:hypothetical protein
LFYAQSLHKKRLGCTMLNLIASDLWYVSLIRLVDVENLSPYWAATASLTRERSLTVSGLTPDATLFALATQVVSSPIFLAPTPALILDVLTPNLLRLLLIRPRTPSDPPRMWTATAWMRGQAAVSALGSMPDEALQNLVLMVPQRPLH